MTTWADGLWAEASIDHEAAAREGALDKVAAELDSVLPFLLAARSQGEYEHRSALVSERLTAIALRCGVEPAEVEAMAGRHYRLLAEALAEGTDPVLNVVDSTHPQGAGPEKPDEHREDADWSGDYAEVPLGQMRGPAPQVVTPRFEGPQPVGEATASLRRSAQGAPVLPAGAGGASVTPDGLPQGGAMPAPSPSPSAPVGAGPSGANVSPGDPFNIQVTSVARSIMGTNPHLPEHEARRVARRVVGSYLRHADLNSSVISDDYGSGNTSAPRGQHGTGDFMRGLSGGGAGGEAAGEGEAAGGSLADVAELAALARRR